MRSPCQDSNNQYREDRTKKMQKEELNLFEKNFENALRKIFSYESLEKFLPRSHHSRREDKGIPDQLCESTSNN